MNELEATRAKLKCLEMVEGTGLKWWHVVKVLNKVQFIAPDFYSDEIYYEFALGVVEGKPVWKGDELWHKHYGKMVAGNGILLGKDNANCFSWNLPASKTIMVELPIEYVEQVAREEPYITTVLTSSCKKAWENYKCK